MNIQICAADSEAYRRALALRHTYLRAPLGLEFTPEELALDQQAVHFIAMDDEEVIGCVIAQPMDTAIKIRQMVVAETYRQRKLGQRLIRALEAHFIANGMHHFTLHARQDVTGFYETLGYQKVGAPFKEIGLMHQKLNKFASPTG
tara:strand:- start:42 stop:479 length:438 start_codon:yes stop_codon:yes gene_type:complete